MGNKIWKRSKGRRKRRRKRKEGRNGGSHTEKIEGVRERGREERESERA